MRQSRLPVRGCRRRARWLLRWPRRAVARVQVEHSRLGQRCDLSDDAPEGPEGPAQRERRGRDDLELPASSDVLVRHDAVRHRIGPRVHQDVHPGLRRQRPHGRESCRPELHRQASGQRIHGASVLRAGLCGAVRRLRLHGAPVLRGDDQSTAGRSTRTTARRARPGPKTRKPATPTSSVAPSRSTGPM
jgi:hypothetical protein